jgi:hypothetical protein
VEESHSEEQYIDGRIVLKYNFSILVVAMEIEVVHGGRE